MSTRKGRSSLFEGGVGFPQVRTSGDSQYCSSRAFTAEISKLLMKKCVRDCDCGATHFSSPAKAWKRVADGQYRAFILFFFDPIGKIFSAYMNDQMEKVGGSESCGVTSVPRPSQT